VINKTIFIFLNSLFSFSFSRHPVFS
jgi:hypothetical protein